ncbi:hypothetical protein C2W62_02665 [Candidatus Entotheonella serta]|nr:hypothetical protein C2W62_02665 [Candidatus Entotheonella serta]
MTSSETERNTLTHLEVHSHYTFLGGTASPADLVSQAATDGLTHLALTDTYGLYGAVAFHRACLPAGIQPILGITVWIRSSEPHTKPSKLVLLASSPTGYQSLCRITSYLQVSPNRHQRLAAGIEWNMVREYRAGLIGVSGGRWGMVGQALQRGHIEDARSQALQLADLFGPDAFVGLSLDLPEDTALASETIALANQIGLGVVALQPVYCLTPQDQPRLKLLAAIDHNMPLAEVPAIALPHQGDDRIGLHWLTPAEMQRRFQAFPQTLDAIQYIFTHCHPALPDGRPIWPIPKLAGNRPPEEALHHMASDGLRAKYPHDQRPAIQPRLDQELDLIIERGYAPLFLIVADIVRFCRDSEIPVSTRGSVANSLVAYCLNITTVDPIVHRLFFARFLNPARSDPPDIDLDFCSRRRDRVLDYVRQTYGADRVALIGSISTMQFKSAVKEVGKAYDLADPTIKRLAKMLPRGDHPDPRRRERRALDDVLDQLDHPTERRVLCEAYALVGQPHHLSLHPGGVVIAPKPLSDIVPLQLAPKGFISTQFDHHGIGNLGLAKIDLLGISALTVLADTADLIRTHIEPAFRLAAIPPTDPETGRLLASGDTIGVFQCESTGARATLMKLQARTVEDLANANAFFKPGPATGGMAANFVRRYLGDEPVTYLHPALKPILEETQGILLFQEQVLRVATEIAGLGWDEADFIRRGISKFREDQVQQMRSQFITGCCRAAPTGPDFNIQQAETLWDQISAFAGYGFNKGHATAYADLSYRMAYLKTHYPAAFMAARLATRGGFHQQAIYLAEAMRLGLVVKPPHVNFSHMKFHLIPASNGTTTLWMGLGQVRDVRRTAIRDIIEQRRKGRFTSLRDLLQRVSLQAKEIEHLVKVGALHGLGLSRAALLDECEDITRSGSVMQLGFAFERASIEAESAAQRLTWERDLLGLPITETPLTTLGTPIDQLGSLADFRLQPGQLMSAAVYRVPGWTGGSGFFISDGRDVIVARRQAGEPPPAWQPVVVQGRLRQSPNHVPRIEIDAIGTCDVREPHLGTGIDKIS